MQSIQQLLNSESAANTIVMMTAADLKKLIDDTNAYTRSCIEEKYEPKYYDVSDLMRKFKIGRTTLYSWINKGKLPQPMHFEGRSEKLLWPQAQIREWEETHNTGKYSHQ